MGKKVQMEQIIEWHQAGDLERAEKAYRKILQQEPKNSNAIHLLGVIHLQRKEYPQAETLIRKALIELPNEGVYLNSLGRLLRETGRLDEAEQCIIQAAASRKDDSAVQFNLGKLYQDKKDWQNAVLAYEKTLEIDPKFTEARHKLTIVLAELSRYPDALKVIEIATEQEPENADAWGMLAYVQLKLEQYEQSIENFNQSLKLEPDVAVNWSNCGVSHQAICNIAEARDCYEKAIALEPNLPEASNNLGTIYLIFGELEKARNAFQASADAGDEYIEPRYCLGEIELSKENYEAGWDGYELRLKKPKHDHRNFGHPEWDGEPSNGKKLLIFTEQGVGDVAMFASCFPDLLAKEKNCLIEADIRLVPILKRSFPEIETIIRPPEVTTDIEIKFPDVDAQIGIGSLPKLFRKTKSSFPCKSYLRADLALIEKWEGRLAELGKGMKVGISWRGGNSELVAYKRTTKFEDWNTLLSVPDVHFVNLQYGNCESEIEHAKQSLNVDLHTWNDTDLMFDLENLFAMMSGLDLVISIDNATVHFAGALGVPAWVMLNKLPEWRWGHDTETCNWYPTLKLFRQKQALEWESVFHSMETELRATAKNFLHDGRAAVQPSHQLVQPIQQLSTTELSETTSNEKITLSIKPKCGAIITVASPQGEADREKQIATLQQAWSGTDLPFAEMIPLTMTDLSGRSHLSSLFNFGIRRAEEQGCEWVLLLQEGDRITPGAISAVAPYLENYDAIWGEIYYMRNDGLHADRLENQVPATNQVSEILQAGPNHAFQCGHFIRTKIAKQFPFHETNLLGSTVGHFLHMWTKHRCLKINEPLIVGLHPNLKLSPAEQQERGNMVNLLWQKGINESRAA